MRLSFEMLKESPDPSKFNNGKRPMAVLLEGEFESYFKNRITPELQSLLDELGFEIKYKSIPAKQLVISDSDFTRNLIQRETGQTEDIGYNKWERRFYKGNKDFVLNAIEYMLDENNILESRSKEIKLRLLDNVKIKEEQMKWQWINIVLPLLIVVIFGLAYHYVRNRKYSRIQPSEEVTS
jgi:ABC-2 type transport system permease protein